VVRAQSVGKPGTMLIFVEGAPAKDGSELTVYTVFLPLLPLPLVK